VLANLLGNAASFSLVTDEPVVGVSLQPADGGRACIRVEDNGVGFDAQRAAELFRPFSRLHSRDAYPGSGIGLSIVQRIIERHGGEVAATSTPGEGACFEFTLPAAATPDETDTTPAAFDAGPQQAADTGGTLPR
jgi:signal transduction histidine kinase